MKPIDYAYSAALVPLLCLVQPAAAAQKWDMPMAYPATNFHAVNARAFGECVKAGTAGDIDIVTHPGGSLFKGNDIKRAVQTGQVQIGERLLSAHENENALFGLDSVPFLATSYQASGKLWESGRADFEKLLARQGLVLLYSVPWPPQGFYFKKKIDKVADMEGTKVRSYNNSTGRVAELSGMVPIQIEAAEITQALITGVIEALITSAVTGQDSKAWEQLSYFYKVNAWLPRNYVIVNMDVWTALHDATKVAIMSCAATAEANGLEMSRQANEKALKDLARHGMEVLDPPKAMADGLRKLGETVTNDWKAKIGEAGEKIVAAYRKVVEAKLE